MTNEEIIKELALYLPEAIKKIGEQIEANGCGDCTFWGREEWEEPCRRCERNCKDYWRKSETKADIPIAVLEQESCDDAISRKSIKQKLQEHHDFFVNAYGGFSNLPQNDKSRVDEITNCIAMVVNEPPVTPQPKTGQWLRMSDLSEQEDDRYKCSRCGNVIHHKNKMNLYTFNSWCGRCGSDNGRK